MVWLCKPIFLLNKRICFFVQDRTCSHVFISYMFVQVQWLGSLQPCPPLLPVQSGVEGMGLSPICVCGFPKTDHPTVCLRDPFWASLLHQSVQLTVGARISPTLVCCVWPEAQYVFVTGVWQHCWKYSKSDQELPLKGCFSWSIRWVCFWLTDSESIWQVLSVCCRFSSNEN